MKIILNMVEMEINEDATLDDVFRMEKRVGQFIVRLNNKLIRRPQYAETVLCDGDEILIKRVLNGG